MKDSARRVFAFEKWKESLRQDCAVQNKLPAFDNVGEYVLRILYENGLEPTVHAITTDGLNGKRVGTEV
jgi:hypothetical protein